MDIPLNADTNVWSLFLPLLYAEIHYRIPGLFSRYYKKEPEIVADVPHRVLRGEPVPVLLIIKDAYLFPVELVHLAVEIQTGEGSRRILERAFRNRRIEAPFWYELFEALLPDGLAGEILVSVRLDYAVHGKRMKVVSDNYKLTRHQPFRVVLDDELLPGKPGWHFGDLHYHSDWTSDQVEFGAPLDVAVRMARAMGLDFLAVTDHSYDLDDSPSDYLRNDPDLPKWRRMWRTVREINRREKGFVVLPGEELSAGNAANRNVHFLILNHEEFLPGSGDSAERWFRTEPELRIDEALRRLSSHALAYAAHPEIVPPFFQKWLIRRGKWLDADYRAEGLDGLQIWNSEKNAFFEAGLRKWVELLLEGRKLSIVAGNDAHGNFGRFRQIGTPFLSMREHRQEIFAKARTGVFVDGTLTFDSLLDALKRQRIIVTDGPFAELAFRNEKKTLAIGETLHAAQGQLRIEAKSSRQFGELERIEFIVGDVVRKKETRRYVFRPPSGSLTFHAEKFVADLPARGYMRLDAFSNRRGKIFRCLTNPIYIRTSESF